MAAAKDDLAARGVPEASIRVVSIAETEWPDTALGCPQPGRMYAQVITPGYRLVLAAGGMEYEYHTDKRATVVLCGER